MPIETTSLESLLPCWATVDRMGHNKVAGCVFQLAGTLVCVVEPALPARTDELFEYVATPRREHILNLASPALYGMTPEPEESVRSWLMQRQPRQRIERPALPGPVAESEPAAFDLIKGVHTVKTNAKLLHIQLAELLLMAEKTGAVEVDVEELSTLEHQAAELAAGLKALAGEPDDDDDLEAEGGGQESEEESEIEDEDIPY